MPDTPVYVRARDADTLTTRHPQFVYEADCPIWSSPDTRVICQLTSNTNESLIWCDDDCRDNQEWTALKKCWAAMGTRFARVWHDTDTPNLATGRVETDPRKFREHLHVASREAEERLGMAVDYQPTDPTDRDALGVTDEGMDTTHDQAVRDGRKDSRGRFVWTV